MPEGDTVFQVAHTLDQALRGQIVRRSQFRVPRLAVADLSGQTVVGCAPRGKHLLLRTDAGRTLHTHLMMHGSWVLQKPGGRWRGGPGHEVRVVLETDAWVALGFRLGVVELFDTVEEAARLGHLGPDLLGSDWDASEAARRLRLRPERAISEALLDQTCLAGIGNIYKSESLFLEGIHPLRPVSQIEEASLDAVVARAHRLLHYAVKHGRQFTTGLYRERFYVFERTGRPCRRCRTSISERRGAPAGVSRITDPDIDRAARITYWCPRCQPE